MPWIQVRIGPQDKETIAEAAKLRGQTVSGYLRALALEDAGNVIAAARKLKEDRRALADDRQAV